MNFSINDKNYRISFNHNQFETPVLIELAGGPRTIHGETRCFLYEVTPGDGFKTNEESKIKVAEGLARCSVADTYNRERGRQLSLKRALQSIWPTPGSEWGAAYVAYSKRRPSKVKDKEAKMAKIKADTAA